MDVKLRVTDAPEESSFSDLVSGDNVLSIPLFQRPYRWGAKHLDLLLEDVGAVSDDVAASVFLGVIVTYSRGTGPGRPVTWEVVDGQQRVTTLYLLIMAAVEVAARRGGADWAAAVVGTYLLVRPLASNPVNTKLVPSYADRAQFASLWTRVSDLGALKSHVSFTSNLPRPPAASGPLEGDVTKQYARLRRVLNGILDEHGQEYLEKYVEIVARHLSFVSISLRDPAVAPKIFERLNARAEPVTIADLVRNEIFSRSGDDAVQAQHVFMTYWEPFVSKFESANTDFAKFLFPYGLIGNPNVRKADLFPELRTRWSSANDPQEIIADLDQYTDIFLALEGGVFASSLSQSINLRLNRIHRVGRPSSVYSFVMQLVEEFRSGGVSEAAVCECLDAIESFLFRRAYQGIEPTGLHAAFKGLWHELKKSGAETGAPAVRAALASKPTITWPTNHEFAAAIASQALYSKKVANYAVRERELSIKGETPSDSFVIEHVAPQTETEPWKVAMGDDYAALVHTWGNLIPLTLKMNPSVGQKPFLQKKESFADSIFSSARHVASTYSEWSSDVVRARNEEISSWALKRWSH
ncbi:DUF262 domain-containing HNH endonuclease family protein [Brevundimonas diminuta]|uniref:DUF262 domain-containing protein n=1 Tax=Brevundimonas diminuta TaxID=293 RepID=UPI00320AA19B